MRKDLAESLIREKIWKKNGHVGDRKSIAWTTVYNDCKSI
jgi:hypothetical protein